MVVSSFRTISVIVNDLKRALHLALLLLICPTDQLPRKQCRFVLRRINWITATIANPSCRWGDHNWSIELLTQIVVNKIHLLTEDEIPNDSRPSFWNDSGDPSAFSKFPNPDQLAPPGLLCEPIMSLPYLLDCRVFLPSSSKPDMKIGSFDL